MGRLFVAFRHKDRNAWKSKGCFPAGRLATRNVIFRYRADGFPVDVSGDGASYKVFLTRAHFVFGPVIIEDSRLWCRNVDYFRYKLYVPAVMHLRGMKWVYSILVSNAVLYDG